ncbi:DUF2946 family protein [Rhodoplanes roseus]|uniref:DUF2946 domain-containing protein n=1 Tax=Rhodoplanes roseus TaxID=29409 RepID=A0A327KSH1_9BRAD|nr:DUF2946 family protein [Rhodoplanes roseus]RAI41880.1 hypothetical protein CH341_20770 [Rhodoplanes roseus]
MIRRACAAFLAAALLLQILLPSLALPGSPTTSALDWALADGFCRGAAASSPDASSAPAPAGQRPDTRGHACCVLCTTPGTAGADGPVAGRAPAWSRVAAVRPIRLAVAAVPASERSPVRPRAPPVG